MQKLYDSVSHNVLLNNLTAFGFELSFFCLISSYLSNCVQSGRVNIFLSFKGLVSSGVPQGSVLGPLQFLIHFNNLPDVVYLSIPYPFADDLSFLYSDSCLNNLQSDIHGVSLCLCCNLNGLDFHLDKTKLISNVSSTIFYLNDASPIECVEQVKDCFFNSSWSSWIHHIGSQFGKASRSFCKKKKKNAAFNSPIKTKHQMYISCVRSNLLYNYCTRYPSFTFLHKLENLQNNAAR